MKTPTETYDNYEIVRIPFPFVDTVTSKVRPAVILSHSNSFNAKIGISILAMITSMKENTEIWPSDILIEDFQSVGLPVLSIIRFKIFTLDHRLILGRLGKLSPNDIILVQKQLKGVFGLS